MDLGSYTPAEYKLWERRERDLRALREKSERFRSKGKKRWREEDVEEERNRRKLLGNLQGRKMGIYERDPEWDDVIPLAQDDGEGALAAIAYTDEYAEGKSVALHSKATFNMAYSYGLSPCHNGSEGILSKSIGPHRAYHITKCSPLHSLAISSIYAFCLGLFHRSRTRMGEQSSPRQSEELSNMAPPSTTNRASLRQSFF